MSILCGTDFTLVDYHSQNLELSISNTLERNNGSLQSYWEQIGNELVVLEDILHKPEPKIEEENQR